MKLPEGIKALIFDCDGTLVDTMPLHLDAWSKAFELNGREFPYDFIENLKGASAFKIMEIYNEHFNDNINIEKVIQDKASYTRDIIKNAKSIKLVADLAKKYFEILPMAVVSGGSFYNVKTSLTAAGLIDLFDIIITSQDKYPPKPNPDSFLDAAKRMNVNPKSCLVFEDGDFGLEAAERAGMNSVDVRKILHPE